MKSQRRTYYFFFCVRPNQSLKLTEPAVNDFARAKQVAAIGQDIATRGLDSVAAALVAAA